MAIPSVVGTPTGAKSTASMTITLPTGSAAGDVAFVYVHTGLGTIPTNTGQTPKYIAASDSGWTSFFTYTSGRRLYGFWRRLDGTTGLNVPQTGDSGDFQIYHCIVVRDAIASGTPYEGLTYPGTTQLDANGVCTMPSINTTGPDRLIIGFAAPYDDTNTNRWNTTTVNTNLSNVTSLTGLFSNAGSGGGSGGFYAGFPSDADGGATGDTTNDTSIDSANASAQAVFAVLPVPAGDQWTHSQPDTIAGTDASTRRVGKGVTDAISGTDQQLRLFGALRSVADSIAASDVPTTSLGVSRTFDDSIAITDQVTLETGKTLQVDDTISITDSRTAAFAKAVADTFAGTDTIAKGLAHVEGDALTIADQIVAARGLSALLQDAITVADASSRAIASVLAEALTIADSLQGVEQNAFGVSDEAQLSDAVSIAIIKPIADAAGLTDFADPQLTIGGEDLTHQVDDAATVSDQATPSAAFSRDLSDAATVADASTRAVSIGLADALTGADDLTATWTALRTVVEDLIIVDQTSIAGSGGQIIDDAATVTDSIDVTVTYARQFDDAAGAGDALAKAPAVSLADLLAGADALGRAWAALLEVDDAGTLTDDYTTSAAGQHVLAIHDSLTGADDVGPAAHYIRTAADAASVADSLARSIGFRVADTLAGADELARASIVLRAIADQVTITDATTRRLREPGVPELVRIRREVENDPAIPDAELEAIRREVEEKNW